jgi:toxin-antitoxin system PIN domain toxin
VIAVDTNILVYCHRNDSPFYAKAFDLIAGLAESRSAWAIPWPCVHEFYNIVTSPRVYKPPSALGRASEQITGWLASPSLVLLHEGPSHWNRLRGLIEAAKLVGGQVHDARIAAICLDHDVKELWSADRDFNRFPGLNVRNPLIG